MIYDISAICKPQWTSHSFSGTATDDMGIDGNDFNKNNFWNLFRLDYSINCIQLDLDKIN